MSKVRKITFVILFLLLTGRMLESVLVGWVWKGRNLPYVWEISFLLSAYILISLAMFLNRQDLRSLNMDRNFVIIFILIGGLYAMLLPLVIGIFLGLVALFNLLIFWMGVFRFEYSHPKYWQVFLFILLFLTPDALIMVLTGKYPNLQDEVMVLQAVFTANLPLVIFEEVIYRGMLWAFLKNLNLKDNLIILAQALLFWMAHIDSISKPATFWLLLPTSSILLGLVVWRSKSITFSTVVHSLHNLLISLPY